MIEMVLLVIFCLPLVIVIGVINIILEIIQTIKRPSGKESRTP
jgi:uncharacterized protein YybS (DUF2232 family)